MRWNPAGLAAVAVLSWASLASAGDVSPRKPRLDLRATPRMGFSPIEVLLVGELKGGQDTEEYYCPGVVWDWGDGSRSAHESDCSPYRDGDELGRLFTARHAFRLPGMYEVHLYLVRAGRKITGATVPVTVVGRSFSGPDE
jgi:hypothetical protein